MKKRTAGLIIVLSLVLTFTTVLAVESNFLLNIEGFKKLAVENSRQSAIDDLEIKARESALEDAKHDAEFVSYTGTRSDMYGVGIKKEVTPLEAEANLEYAKKEKEENLENLRLDVYKATLGLLLAQKELQMEAEKLYILKEKYGMVEARYKEGKITDNDLYDAKYALDKKAIDKDKVEKKVQSAGLELKRLLNLKLDETPLKVEDELVLSTWEVIDIEKIVLEALNKSADIFKKSEELKAKEKTLEVTGEYYKDGDFTYDDNKVNLETTKVGLEDAKTNLEVQIRNKYNDILTKKDKVELAQQWEGIQEKKLDNAELKYKKGLISKEELFNAKEKFLDAQYQKFAEIHDYNALKAEFEALYK